MEGSSSVLESGNPFGEIDEILDEVEKRFNRLTKFDILKHTPYDHNYFYRRSEILPRDSAPKAIRKEWEILEKGLPDWDFVRKYIFVRTYASRLDLMRVAIAGLENTPYRYGLFLFDITIPNDFPVHPPQVSYSSNYGNCFTLTNSKLQQGGSLSLPILEYRNWVNRQFSILEILEYIQNSVLNYEVSVPNPKNKKQSYYDNVEKEGKKLFMENCKAMVSLLKMSNPPDGFGDFVAGYFRKWSHRILLCCKEEGMQNENHELFVRLLKGLEANGSYCRHHYDEKVKLRFKEEKEQREQREWMIPGTVTDVMNSWNNNIFNLNLTML